MNPEQAKNAVRNSARVQATYGHDRTHIRAEGTVLAYSGSPMILLETDDGERVWWLADLIAPASPAAAEGDNQ